jgi:hypothetical protein
VSEAKPWYTSRSLIFNIASLLVVAAGFIAENTGALNLPDAAGTWATLLVALGNAYLRLITAQPIAGTPAAKEVPPTAPG